MKRFLPQGVKVMTYNASPAYRQFCQNSAKAPAETQASSWNQTLGGVLAFGLGISSYFYVKNSYDEMPAPKKENKPQLKKDCKNKYLLICGPSGVGKGTLLKEVFAKYPKLTGFSVSYTNRPPREGEKHGVDYNFVTEEQFVKEIEEGNFQEHVHFANKRYGTNKQYLEKLINEGKVCVQDVEIKGAKMINDSGHKGILVFIRPPTFEALEERLLKRGTENVDVIKSRLAQAKIDLESQEKDDFFTYTIVNDDLKLATEKIIKIFEDEFLE